jgi:hypothetical protein
MYIKFFSLLCTVLLLGGCQSAKQIENSFDEQYLANSTDLIFSSPNFSSLHLPPLMSGFAYVEAFTAEGFCEGESKLISKVTVTRDNRTQYSKFASGNIVLNVGLYVKGATGGGLTGNSIYSLEVDPAMTYKITLTEARPLVTSYSIDIEAVSDDGVSSLPAQFVDGYYNICKKK